MSFFVFQFSVSSAIYRVFPIAVTGENLFNFFNFNLLLSILAIQDDMTLYYIYTFFLYRIGERRVMPKRQKPIAKRRIKKK